MSDKEKIKEEIERLYKHYLNAQEFDSGYNMALDDILKFIDSLPEEPASEDLEEEVDNYFKDWTFDDELSIMAKPNHYFAEFDDIKEIARHFAEWQREKDIKLEKTDDLEKFAQKWAYSNYHKVLDEVNCDCLYSGVKKGAEWQKQKDLEDSLKSDMTMPNKFYEKGRADAMNEIKEAVETTIVNDWQYGKDPDHAIIPAIHQRIEGFDVGDKVKIIIVKEEQQ